MGARRDYVVNVVLRGEAGGLDRVERELREVEDLAEGLNGRNVDVNLNIGGNFEQTLRDFEGHLDNLHGRDITINCAGNFEESLRNIESHLETIARNQTIKLNIDDGNAQQTLGHLEGMAEGLASNLKSIGSAMVREFQGVSRELGKVQNGIRSLKPSDVGNKMANDFYGASMQVGNIQKELNSLKAPQIQPVEMNQYYGSYDQLGHLNMGAIGGSSILSMLGLQGFRGITWGNASGEQTNTVLLQKMDQNESQYRLSDTSYEGGADTITHAVSTNRTIRNMNLISQLYSFQQATGASNKALMSNVFGQPDDDVWGSGSGVDVIAAFGELVQLMTGSEQLGTTAMFDLAKGFKGQYAAIDTYGITAATLAEKGWKEGDSIEEYLRAVGEIIGSNQPNALISETTEGSMTLLRKKFQKSGREIGQLFMGPVDFISKMLYRLESTEFKFAGITIPKGTFSKIIIGMTGIVSSIEPMQRTLRALQDTYGRVTGAISTANNSLQTLAEKIVSLGNAAKIDRFKNFGAEGILEQERYTRENQKEILDANIKRLQNTKGIHNFTDDEIAQSDMTWGQKRLTRNRRNFDSILFNLEGEHVSDEVRDSIHEQLKEERAGLLEEGRKKGLEGADLRKYVNENKTSAQDAFANYVAGRKNEISELSNWQKTKKGISGSFKPQTSAFSKAFKHEKDRYKSGGFLDQIRSKTVGNFRGLREGLRAMRETGGLRNSLGNLGSVFTGLLGAINPVTVALYGLMGIFAALGGVFAIAYANSKEFQEKVAELGNKLHDMFDMLIYAVGDWLKQTGLTESGGAQGIVEVATAIVDFLENLVDLVTDILSSITGRDLRQSKAIDANEKDLKTTIKTINQQEEEKGIGQADHALYEKAKNLANRIMYYDPGYFTSDKIQELKLTENKDDKGYTLYDVLMEGNEDSAAYVLDEQYAQLQAYGVDMSKEDLEKNLKDENGQWSQERIDQLNKSIGDVKAHTTSSHFGSDWNDTPFAKATGMFDKNPENDAEAGSSTLGRFIDPILDVLDIIKWAVIGILAAMAIKTGADIAEDILEFRRRGNGSWTDAMKETVKERYPELSETYDNWRGKGKEGEKAADELKDAAKDGISKDKVDSAFDKDVPDGKKKRKIDPNKSMEDIKKDFEELKNAGEDVGKNANKKEGFLSKVRNKADDALGWAKNTKAGKYLSKGMDWVTEKVGGKGIMEHIGTWLGGKIGLSALPVIGQILDVLWLAWDLTSWIGDWLDTNIPWAGQLFEMINPLRMIQKHWNDITGAFEWACNAISGWLRSIGLGWVVDMCQRIYQILTGIVETAQHIPILGWFLGGDGDASKIGESWAKVTGESKFNGAGNNTTEEDNVFNPHFIGNGSNPQFIGTGNGLNSNYTTTSPYNLANAQALNGTALNTAASASSYATNTPITNNIHVQTMEDPESISKAVVNTLNNRVLWDPQRAGRAVGGGANPLMGH